ncbi:MAG: DUF6279 family lipoprotein [Pseudomonas sp.]
MLVLLLSACSSTRLAYDNLERLVSWKSGDYVSLTRDQKRWLSGRVQTHRDWHCSTELPEYRRYLAQLQPQLSSKALDADMLVDQLPEIQPAVDRLLEELAPTLAELLSDLTAQQVDELIDNMQLQHQELHERYVAPAEKVQNQERATRLEKRLTPWLGRLTAEQRQRVQSWSAELARQNSIWLDNRSFWLDNFISTLKQRDQPDFSERINALLTDRQQFWTPHFRERSEINARLGAEMLADLLSMASDRQIQRMENRLARLETDLQRMQCTAAT